MHQLIHQIRPLREYDSRNGWIAVDAVAGIRNLLKKQALLLLEKQGFDTSSVVAEFI